MSDWDEDPDIDLPQPYMDAGARAVGAIGKIKETATGKIIIGATNGVHWIAEKTATGAVVYNDSDKKGMKPFKNIDEARRYLYGIIRKLGMQVCIYGFTKIEFENMKGANTTIIRSPFVVHEKIRKYIWMAPCLIEDFVASNPALNLADKDMVAFSNRVAFRAALAFGVKLHANGDTFYRTYDDRGNEVWSPVIAPVNAANSLSSAAKQASTGFNILNSALQNLDGSVKVDHSDSLDEDGKKVSKAGVHNVNQYLAKYKRKEVEA